MRTLYHMPLDPASRMIRVALAEKGLPVRLVELRPWDDDGALAAKNPAGEIPVLLDEPPTGGEISISPTSAIFEYLEEVYAAQRLHPATSAGRAEMRRLVSWLNGKFEIEVIALIVRERIDKRLKRRGQPDHERLSRGGKALEWHLDYFDWLLEHRPWFAGETYSYADIAAAAALSSLDYVSAITWDKFPHVREWYARMKSRPSLRPLLSDRIEGLPPPSHFDDPDF